jgi:hypothetical protein
MGHAILTAAAARRAALDCEQYLLWVRQRDAQQFNEPGWLKLEPPRDGAVLFVHRQREFCAIRRRGIL